MVRCAGHHCSTYKLSTTAQYELRIPWQMPCWSRRCLFCQEEDWLKDKHSKDHRNSPHCILNLSHNRKSGAEQTPTHHYDNHDHDPRPTTHNSQPASHKITATATATTTTTTPTTPIAIAAATPTTTSPTSTTTAPTTITTGTTTTATTTPSTTSWLTPAL